MSLGTSINTIRKRKCITQKELSKLTGLSLKTLSNIELDITHPQRLTLELLARGLEVPIPYILFCSIQDSDIPEKKRKYFRQVVDYVTEFLIEKP